jgi:hypothetical protein
MEQRKLTVVCVEVLDVQVSSTRGDWYRCVKREIRKHVEKRREKYDTTSAAAWAVVECGQMSSGAVRVGRGVSQRNSSRIAMDRQGMATVLLLTAFTGSRQA